MLVRTLRDVMKSLVGADAALNQNMLQITQNIGWTALCIGCGWVHM